LSPIRFAFDRTTLTPEAREQLDAFAGCLLATAVRIQLDGFCDPRGSAEYNRWLAWDRAAAVAAHLKGRGVPAKQLSTRFRNLTGPACPASSEACFADQRRVEATELR
jgi:peptidoglycan-associated lipoprotein